MICRVLFDYVKVAAVRDFMENHNHGYDPSDDDPVVNRDTDPKLLTGGNGYVNGGFVSVDSREKLAEQDEASVTIHDAKVYYAKQ